MPNVQKLKAKERLEAIDQEMKGVIAEQEKRLNTLENLDPTVESNTAERKKILAETKDGNLRITKLREERSELEGLIQAEENLESERREDVSKRSPKSPKKTEEQKLSEAFSWYRFVDCALNERFSGAEKEVVDLGYAEAKEIGRSVGEGFPIPTALVHVPTRDSVKMQKRDQSTTAAEGGYMIETTLGNLIPALTPRTRVLGMGVTFLPGLSGNLAWPRETNVIQGASVAEKVAAAESSIIFDQVTMNPKRVAHYTEFTRKLMHQGKQAIDRLVPDRLNRGLGIEWDRQLIEGSGASEELLGILNIPGIGVVAIGANGGAPTYAHMLKLEELIADANADIGDIRGLTNPKFRRKLKETEKFSTTGMTVWEEGNSVNSYPVEVSTQVPSDLTKGSGTALSAFIHGYWPGLMVGHWGTDIIVNPFTLDKEAMIRVSAHLWTDSDVEHAAMFAAIKDAVTT